MDAFNGKLEETYKSSEPEDIAIEIPEFEKREIKKKFNMLVNCII